MVFDLLTFFDFILLLKTFHSALLSQLFFFTVCCQLLLSWLQFAECYIAWTCRRVLLGFSPRQPEQGANINWKFALPLSFRKGPMHSSSVTKRKSIVEDGQQEKIPPECSRIWENQRIVKTLRPEFLTFLLVLIVCWSLASECFSYSGQWLSYTSTHGNAGTVDTGTIIAATILRILADGAEHS